MMSASMLQSVVTLAILTVGAGHSTKNTMVTGGMYPIATETRDLRTLDGLWDFRKIPSKMNSSHENRWHDLVLDESLPVVPMPVPSSYNDVGLDPILYHHVGLVWYEKKFRVPSSWGKEKQRVWLRFSSVHYAANVSVNGKPVMYHEIGHLPFETEVTDVVSYRTSNLLTVVVDNTLTSTTIPQGYISGDGAHKRQGYLFDFFNYAGIDRSVYLYSTPQTYIDDVSVKTDIKDVDGIVHYNISYQGSKSKDVECHLELSDMTGKLVSESTGCVGSMNVKDAHLWWPYLMHAEPGYLYTLKILLLSSSKGERIDTYEQDIGIRTVTWDNKSIYLNNKPIYMKGFGMHEDSDWRGKGWDQVLWVRNFNLIQWVGANAFRTSHYPYAEEVYQMADRRGIMIIDECPADDTQFFTNKLLENHKQSLTELIRRDKNHPSVIMWSISNEPWTQVAESDDYFKKVVQHVKSLDPTRPVTFPTNKYTNEDLAVNNVDVIAMNRYPGWYSHYGELDTIIDDVVVDAIAMHELHNKPVFISEYGAETYVGLHSVPEVPWSEEYQIAMMSQFFKAFDQLRKAEYFVGEFIWNFADFRTPQSVSRVNGNRKGIFTRSREPKSSAFHLRARYHALTAASGADSSAAPLDVRPYVIDDHRKHSDVYVTLY